LFVLSIVCCVVIAAGAGVGIWGSVVMTQNVNDAANFTNRTVQTFTDILDSVVGIFRTISTLPNMSETIDPETLDQAENVSAEARFYANAFAQYSDIIDVPRQVFMYVTLLLPLFLMILVALSCVCCWWMSWAMSFAGFILTFLSLVTFGFLYPMTSGIADACVFLDNSLADPDNDNFINSIFSCGEGSVLSSLSNMSISVFDTAGNVTCELYSALENAKLPCDTDGDGTIVLLDPTQMCDLVEFKGSDECNLDTFAELSRNVSMFDWKIGCFCETIEHTGIYSLQGECGVIHSLYEYPESLCPETDNLGHKCQPFYCHNEKEDVKVSLEQCSTSCSDEQLAGNASTVLTMTKVAVDSFELYNNMIKPYLNCESIVGIALHSKDFICVNMMNAVTPMYIGEIIAAVGSFVGTFVALLSTKRFRKKNRRKYARLMEVEMHDRT